MVRRVNTTQCQWSHYGGLFSFTAARFTVGVKGNFFVTAYTKCSAMGECCMMILFCIIREIKLYKLVKRCSNLSFGFSFFLIIIIAGFAL